MRVKTNVTLKCDEHFIIADTILDDSKMEFPDFIKDLVNEKSHLVTVLEEPAALLPQAEPEGEETEGEETEGEAEGESENKAEGEEEEAPTLKRRSGRK